MVTHFSLYTGPYKGINVPLQHKTPSRKKEGGRATHITLVCLISMMLLFKISVHALIKSSF